MNTDLIKSLGKDATVLVVLFGFALAPLPLIEGNPTGLKLVLNEWHRVKDVKIVDYVVALNTVTDSKAVKMDEIKEAEFDYVSHKWIKPKRFEYDDQNKFRDDLDDWRDEYKDKKERIKRLKSEKSDLHSKRLQLLAHATQVSS